MFTQLAVPKLILVLLYKDVIFVTLKKLNLSHFIIAVCSGIL